MLNNIVNSFTYSLNLLVDLVDEILHLLLQIPFELLDRALNFGCKILNHHGSVNKPAKVKHTLLGKL